MTRRLMLAVVVTLALTAPAGAASGPVSVRVERSEISTALGHRFSFTTTIENRGSTATEPLVAHLNVLSLRPGTYVDPEDWSSQRTRYLGPLPAGGSRAVTWRLEAVNSGSFAVYVAVLPRTGAGRVPTTGPEILVAVAERKTLNSGGILPLALGVPLLLGLVAGAVRLKRRSR